MNNLNSDDINILDLPDEILFMIFKKLNSTDVLHSLVDINKQFRRLALDSLYVRDLDMTDFVTINSLYDQTSSIDTKILSKIYEKILPRIHHQVHKLTIEQYSMKNILLAAIYPKLYYLSLINFQEEILYQYLTNDLILRDLMKQITHLNIDTKNKTEYCSVTVSKIFEIILSLCKNLTSLNFCDMFPIRTNQTSMFYLSSKRHMSSTLIKLKINVASLVDCLYLLDGRLDSLTILIINVRQIFDPVIDIGSRVKLKLYLSLQRFNSTYIDGIQLYDQFLGCMTQLKRFIFWINTKVFNETANVELQSNKDIQHSFIGRGYEQVASYVHTNSTNTRGQCIIYSLPYDFENFVDLDNSFQGGVFYKVRQLTMSDRISFEHQLFQRISADFPFLQILYISNSHPQNNKSYSSLLITFPYLKFLDLQYAHVNYAELFLLKNNVHLPRLLNLRVEYESLANLTNNFTNDATYFNFHTLKSLDYTKTISYTGLDVDIAGEPFVRKKIPLDELLIEELLDFSTLTCPNLAKSWFRFADCAYLWGRQLLARSIPLSSLNLGQQVRSILPSVCSFYFQMTVSELSSLHSYRTDLSRACSLLTKHPMLIEQLLPQQLYHPDGFLRDYATNLLIRIAKDFPQLILYSVVVEITDDSKMRRIKSRDDNIYQRKSASTHESEDDIDEDDEEDDIEKQENAVAMKIVFDEFIIRVDGLKDELQRLESMSMTHLAKEEKEFLIKEKQDVLFKSVSFYS
ncbi:unnamed protein product [Rotaria socialis]|uniref:F-box domain-containing protein n=1 Tax=Rotaria socialis TaxID=392032 RepID=A0A817SXM5_9BILA|nr:unnamed protein product [Rotaria socialis]